jgi:hypothetical protein
MSVTLPRAVGCRRQPETGVCNDHVLVDCLPLSLQMLKGAVVEWRICMVVLWKRCI